MDIIKSVLNEELESSLSLREYYEEKMRKIPPGNLSDKKINGKSYIYLQYRDGDKVISRSLSGLPDKDIQKYRDQAEKRRNYKKYLKEVESKIKYLRKILKVK